MRKRRIVWVACRAALLSLAMAGAVAGRAAAQSSATPWLGVTTQEISDDLRDGLDYQGSGVIVNRVVSDSPAQRAGIRKGDVIVSFNSRTIDSPSELSDVVRSARVGQSVSLVIVRDGARRNLSARLGEWPEDMEYDWETPVPSAPEAPRAPRAPRAPKAPKTPRAYTFNWNGDEVEGMRGLEGLKGLEGLDDLGNFTMLGRGRLGVHVQDLNDGLGEALGVPDGNGVLVVDVIDDTPAKRAGLRAGDVITRVGDASVDDTNELRRALRERDGNVTITVIRKGVRRTVEADLEARDADSRDMIKIRRGDGGTRMLRIPNTRSRTLLRDRDDNDADRQDMERELQQLRQELRDLRQKMQEMEDDK